MINLSWKWFWEILISKTKTHGRTMVILALLIPFALVPFTESSLYIFAGIVGWVFWPSLFFTFVLSHFVIALLIFHFTFFKLARPIFGDEAIVSRIKFFDYIWYTFGAIALSYYSISVIQTIWLDHLYESYDRWTDFYQLAANGLVRDARPYCQIALATEAPLDFRSVSAEINLFCRTVVAFPDPKQEIDGYCRVLISSISDLKIAGQEWLKGLGIRFNRFVDICANHDGWVGSANLVNGLAEEVNKVPRGSEQPLWTFTLLAVLAALKISKVSIEVFMKKAQHAVDTAPNGSNP